MEVVYPCCCGLDVHKKSITACVLWAQGKGKSRKEKKRFGTFTHDLLQLADWLGQCGVTHVDRKSTRLNSSHSQISYAVFCLKKKKNPTTIIIDQTPRDTPTLHPA